MTGTSKTSNALIAELDGHIVGQLESAARARAVIEKQREELNRLLDDLAGALRLYRSLTGTPHPSERVEPVLPISGGRSQPRLAQVTEVLARAQGPLSLQEIVASLPDAPENGAVTAALHRAVQKGYVRRVDRGIYELDGKADEGGTQTAR